jgi:methyltransferase-like protein 6
MRALARAHERVVSVCARKLGREMSSVTGPESSPTAPAATKRDYHDSDFAFEDHARDVEEARRRRVALLPPPFAALDASASRAQAWHKFHSRHAGRFFHPRHYLLSAFPELASLGRSSVLEIGCGNGSNVFPILSANPDTTVFASDITPAALRTLLQQRAEGEDTEGSLGVEGGSDGTREPRLVPFLFDVVSGGAPASVPGLVVKSPSLPNQPDAPARAAALTALHASFATLPPSIAAGGSMDAVLATFVFSALPPADHPAAVRTLFRAVRPGGLLLFRDYGVNDMAQLRMEEGTAAGAESDPGLETTATQRLGERLYRRGDGTLSYFFAREEVVRLFEAAGFETVDARYSCVQNVNRKQSVVMRRVFVTAKFRRRKEEVGERGSRGAS